MRGGWLAVPLVAYVALTLACATASHLPDTRMVVSIRNTYRDPVDVRLYCGMAQVARARWVMPHTSESLRIHAGAGCILRFTVAEAITGGPYTHRPTYDSGFELSAFGACQRLDITAGNLVTNSYAMPEGCPR